MSLDKSIPSIVKSSSFQAWALLIVLVLVIVMAYDSYTGKRMLGFFFPKKSNVPTAPTAPTKPKEEA